MSKKKTFSFPIGNCEYEHKKGLYSFTVKSMNGGFHYSLNANPCVDQFFADGGNVSDMARGLVGLYTVGTMDREAVDKIKTFDGLDTFMPAYLGNYHQCLLEGTPWGEEEFGMVEQLFSPEVYKYLKAMTAMYVDAGVAVMVSPVLALEKLKA